MPRDSRILGRVPASVGSLALFLALSAGFLWRPLWTGEVFLPADLVFRYDHFWKGGRDPSQVEVQNPLLADVSDYFHPYRAHALAELRRGRLPLWNPYILGGTPFFASAQAALLDPVNLLTLATGPLASWTWGAWLRIALLGWFTWGFARALGRSFVAAAGAGIVFMLSGFVVVWLNYPIVTSLVWMPALFWAGLRLVETGRRRFVAATALAIGALLVGGHPETQFLVGIAWAAFCAHALALLPPPRAVVVPRRIGWLAAAMGIGLALGAAQWVPFVDFLFRSHAFAARAEPSAPFDAVETVLRLAVLLLPNLGGTRVDKDYWLPESDYLNFNERTGYIGLLALGLAVLGFQAARRGGGADARRAWFLGAGALIAILLAIQAPGFHLAKRLPLLDVGHGVRWVIVSSFFAALLAGRGLDALRAARPGAGELRRFAVAFGVSAGVGLAVLTAAWSIFAFGMGTRRALLFRTGGEPVLVQVQILKELLDPVRFVVSPPLFFLLAGSAVLALAWRGWLRPRACPLLLCAPLYLDLWSFGSRYNPVTPEEQVFPPTPALRLLQERLGRERVVAGGDMLRPNVAMLFGLRDLRGYEDLVDRDFARLYGNTLERLEEAQWVGKAPQRHDPRLEREDVRLLRLASVRFLLSARPLSGPLPLPYRLASSTPGVLAYESPEVLPRAYAVLRARAVPDLESAREALLAWDFDPLREVILVGEGTALAGSSSDPPSVTWRVDEPETVVLDASMPDSGYLVLTDRYSPDWEATVDGEPARVHCANGVFRAVPVPKGTHAVRFRYRPRLVYASAGVSAAAALAALLCLVLPGARRSPRGRRAPPPGVRPQPPPGRIAGVGGAP